MELFINDFAYIMENYPNLGTAIALGFVFAVGSSISFFRELIEKFGEE